MIHSVGGNFSISDLLQPRAEVKNAEQHGRSSFNTPAQFIIIHLKKKCFLTIGNLSTYGVETIVNDMFHVFAHSNLFHQFVFVTVHSGQLSNMGKHVLEPIGQLESVHIVQTILDMRIHNKFGQPKKGK